MSFARVDRFEEDWRGEQRKRGLKNAGDAVSPVQ